MCGRPALVAGRLQMGSQVWVAALGGETAKKHSVRRGVSVACLAFEAPSSRRQRAHAATFSIGLLLHGAELPPSDISKQKTTQLTAQNRAPPRHKAGTCPPRPGAVALGAGRTSTAWPSQPRKLCSHHSASRPCGAFHAATTAAAGPQPLLPGQASCACSAAGGAASAPSLGRPKPDRRRHAVAHCLHRQAAPLGLANERRTPAEGGGRGSWPLAVAATMHARVRVPGLLEHYQQHVQPEASGAQGKARPLA